MFLKDKQTGLLFYLAIILSAAIYPAQAREADLMPQYILNETVLEEVVPEPIVLVKPKTYGNGTCVPYARERTGILLYGSAATFMGQAGEEGYTTSTVPTVGSIVALAEGPIGHVAVVEELTDDGFRISEQNYKGLYIVSERVIPFSYEAIIGFIKPH